MRPRWLLWLVALAAGCAANPPAPETRIEYVPQRVEVPVRCKVEFPERPVYALDDPALKGKTLADKASAALVEIEQRRAYEDKLEAALKACADAIAK